MWALLLPLHSFAQNGKSSAQLKKDKQKIENEIANTQKLLKKTVLPGAVLCADDSTAAGAADALNEMDLTGKIPVCGMNNTYLASLMRFSSIDLNLAERARLAANLLADILEGKAPPAPHIVKIQPSFIERESK